MLFSLLCPAIRCRTTKENSLKVAELKFIYSEKATKFREISTIDLTGTTQDKCRVEISQNFVDFSEYMNFTRENIYCSKVVTTEAKKIKNYYILECLPSGN